MKKKQQWHPMGIFCLTLISCHLSGKETVFSNDWFTLDFCCFMLHSECWRKPHSLNTDPVNKTKGCLRGASGLCVDLRTGSVIHSTWEASDSMLLNGGLDLCRYVDASHIRQKCWFLTHVELDGVQSGQ